MKALKNEQLGVLNERILIQRPIHSQSISGEDTVLWENVQEVWANVDFTKQLSQESEQSEALHAFTGIEFIIRKNPDFSPVPEWRVAFNNVTYDIFAVLDFPSGAFQKLRTVTAYNDGDIVQVGLAVVDPAGLCVVNG